MRSGLLKSPPYPGYARCSERVLISASSLTAPALAAAPSGCFLPTSHPSNILNPCFQHGPRLSRKHMTALFSVRAVADHDMNTFVGGCSWFWSWPRLVLASTALAAERRPAFDIGLDPARHLPRSWHGRPPLRGVGCHKAQPFGHPLVRLDTTYGGKTP